MTFASIRGSWLLGVAVWSAAPGLAHADELACREAYQSGQRSHRDKKLLRAREEFLLCARNPCPKVFQGECAGWLREVESELPTVVFSLRGTPGPGARISVDGAPFQGALDALARPLDPGAHRFAFDSSTQHVLVEQSILEGVKAQSIVFDLGPSTPPVAPPVVALPREPASKRAAPRWPFWALSGVGVAAVATSAAFGVKGLVARGDLSDCRPDCSLEQVHGVRHDFLASDIALGIGVVTLASALVVYLLRPHAPPASSASLRDFFSPPIR